MAQVVAVQEIPKASAQVASSPTILDSLFAILPYIIIFALIILGIIFFLKWFLNQRSERSDIFKKYYKEVATACKLNRREAYFKPIFGVPSWIMKKGSPVLITYPKVRPVDEEETQEQKAKKTKAKAEKEDYTPVDCLNPGETRKLGTYLGHCTTSDGCLNILVASSKDKIFKIFAKKFIIRLRVGTEKVIIDKDDSERKKTKTITVPADSFTMSDEYIMINAFSIELRAKHFFYPVNRDQKGRVIDTRAYSNMDINEISLQRQNLDFAQNMVYTADELIHLNPFTQFEKKTQQESIKNAG